eukprot:TRINITY_DN8842_c0_g2_i1.p2 TRINITY_DN8842_c0_g2~~TRINITY_DN8842_c0_g2_i1.p2  ORF type:complete len:208 (-),score=29.87 TRINITY_DN8842_c0_g2_i1:123-746(-)
MCIRDRLNIFGVVNNQYSLPIAEVIITLFAQSSDTTISVQSEEITTSANGLFVWQEQVELRNSYTVTVQAQKQGFSTIIQTFLLNQNENDKKINDFSHKTIISMTPPKFQGKISGNIKNKLGHIIQLADITATITVSGSYSYSISTNVNLNGEFVLIFNVYQGETYNIDLEIEAQGYLAQKIQNIFLSPNNNFSQSQISVILVQETC